MYETPKFLGSGDGCLVVEFSDGIDRAANVKLQKIRRILDAKKVPGIREFVPTYRSLSIHHDPMKLSRERLEEIVRGALGDTLASAGTKRRILVMPVAYGGEFGPDMENVCRHTGFDEEEVIRRHTGTDCYCFMLGFTPGFPYLGGMDPALETPRLKNPRVLIPAGSVGIAGKQTGAYSIDSPGGWQLIGRTPLRLFDPQNTENPTLVDAGDWVRFRRIEDGEFERIAAAVAACRYTPEHIREGGSE
jgi:KipI family sensor histidine kinase inhibitor